MKTGKNSNSCRAKVIKHFGPQFMLRPNRLARFTAANISYLALNLQRRMGDH